ncbi:MBL fold metallo-hydrolase [Kordiimonas pumila]|uniref:MBL fold metallo-hydrolase n=1 Tax=Kordiimonas pumila TaxID=2161677 RepID=A0ABV7D1T6_9PROT|nr:MBL fold metallo-hydrolase [Kordiimonas pumila]
MLIFRQLFDEESYTYTYLLADSRVGEAIFIDPVKSKIEQYIQILADLSLTLKYAVDTHVHADHVTALGDLRERLHCTSVIGAATKADCVDYKIKDGESLSFGAYSLVAIATPGHTDDSYSFFLDVSGEKMVFTGDTLLIRGTGRTDFQNGDARMQYSSLTKKLLTLPPDTWVYPAHDYKGWTRSTIAEEKAHNPRLQVKNMAEYVALMDSLKLLNPKFMDVAVPANLACGQVK